MHQGTPAGKCWEKNCQECQCVPCYITKTRHININTCHKIFVLLFSLLDMSIKFPLHISEHCPPPALTKNEFFQVFMISVLSLSFNPTFLSKSEIRALQL